MAIPGIAFNLKKSNREPNFQAMKTPACFLLTLPWTTVGFWNAVIGLFVLRLSRDPTGLICPIAEDSTGDEPIKDRTAILSCIRNEDADAVARNLSIMLEGLAAADGANLPRRVVETIVRERIELARAGMDFLSLSRGGKFEDETGDDAAGGEEATVVVEFRKGLVQGVTNGGDRLGLFGVVRELPGAVQVAEGEIGQMVLDISAGS